MNYETKTLPSGIVIENRPASNNNYRWCIKNTHCLHNEGEPAIEYKNRSKFWHQHGKLHRLDGPAAEYADGSKCYYVDNILYLKKDYCIHPDVLSFKYLKDHPELKAFV